MRFLALFLVAIAVVGSRAAVTRSLSDIKAFEEFLRNSVNGKPMKSVMPSGLQNEEETSGKFEGDILLTEEQIQEMIDDYAAGRNGLTSASRLWPNRVVVYEINTSQFTSAQVSAIEAGISDLNRLSCLTMRKRTTESAYIQVTGNSGGCFATVGYTGSRQGVNLQPNTVGSGCFRHGTIVHEFLHGIGFYHMQSTYDRDDWVRIVWEKIQPGTENNFNKYTSSQVTNLGQTYDYGSVMHYSEYGFSTDGSKTIVPLKSYSGTIGQRVGMSQIDINRLNRLYSC